MKKLVFFYLSAIVLANLLIAYFGANLSILSAFIFIGMDFASRDFLHESWKGKGLFWKMALLIASGSILSAILNWNALPIAIASFAAFAAAGLVDTLSYAILGKQSRLIRMNGSNILASAIDSIVFPALAFGFPLLWPIVIGQFVVKVAGGFIWTLILNKRVSNER